MASATSSGSSDSLTTGSITGSPTHPTYATWAPVWRKLAHIYEGSGGFLDGTYLVAHPREWEDWNQANPVKPTKKLKARRALARYENVGATILDQKRSAIFREAVVRTVGEAKKNTPHPIETWWENVDGAGTCISDWMAEAFTPAALFGSTIHVMDRPAGGSPLTKADEQAPYLRMYTPLDMTDWLTDDRNRLVAVRLLEATQRASITDPIPAIGGVQERVLTADGWQILARGGQAPVPASGVHAFGCLPVVIHYAKRRALAPVIGASVLADPNLYIDLYNLTSELRELLRLQTFGLLNIELGTGPDHMSVEQALTLLGTEKGAENVIFSPGAARYLQPDTANITVYQAERDALLRTIYRLTAIPWEADSKDAESTGSMKLKREDMNQVLASYADECERAEYAIAKLWFRATYGDRWEQEFANAKLVIRYPDTFNVTPFMEILDQAQAALTLEMPPEFMVELKRRLVLKFLPDATPDVIDKIEKALQAQAKDQAENAGDAVAKAKKVLLQFGANPEAMAA